MEYTHLAGGRTRPVWAHIPGPQDLLFCCGFLLKQPDTVKSFYCAIFFSLLLSLSPLSLSLLHLSSLPLSLLPPSILPILPSPLPAYCVGRGRLWYQGLRFLLEQMPKSAGCLTFNTCAQLASTSYFSVCVCLVKYWEHMSLHKPPWKTAKSNSENSLKCSRVHLCPLVGKIHSKELTNSPWTCPTITFPISSPWPLENLNIHKQSGQTWHARCKCPAPIHLQHLMTMLPRMK